MWVRLEIPGQSNYFCIKHQQKPLFNSSVRERKSTKRMFIKSLLLLYKEFHNKVLLVQHRAFHNNQSADVSLISSVDTFL